MRHDRPPLRRFAAVAVVAVLLAACGDDLPADGGRPVSAGEVSGEVLVSAAASLTDVFGDIEAAFEAAHPAADVVLNLGGSSTLREQVLQGAPVDVFASADTATMAPVADAGMTAGDPQLFATNRLQIAVPAGNPAGITGLEDVAEEAPFLGLCAAEVPCGDLARQALDAAGVTAAPDTNEPDVRALLTKVEAGELDAGITYVTDVVAAGDGVEGIEIPSQFNVTAEYPIAALAAAPNPGGAAAFVDFVLSQEGQSLLAAHGFCSP